jgi:hypothetical protein
VNSHSFTADELEWMFRSALRDGDIRGVEAALTVMAGQDPRRAQRLFDETRAALAVIQDPGSTGAVISYLHYERANARARREACPWCASGGEPGEPSCRCAFRCDYGGCGTTVRETTAS